MRLAPLRIYVDFDGTVSVQDVGDSIYERFLSPERSGTDWLDGIIGDWKAEKISSRECLENLCENTIVSRPELDAHLDGHALTPGFSGFVEVCRRREIPLMILSDGFDYYIEFLLAKYGLSEIPFRANRMFFGENGLGADFPYFDLGCGRCANCKRAHIENDRRTGERVMYIGDGYSDRYAIRSADIVFACGELAAYCDRNGIAYHPFGDFHDVIRHLETSDGHD